MRHTHLLGESSSGAVLVGGGKRFLAGLLPPREQWPQWGRGANPPATAWPRMMRGAAQMSRRMLLGGLRNRHSAPTGMIGAVRGGASARPFSAGADIKVGHMESMEGNMAGAPPPPAPEHIVRSSGWLLPRQPHHLLN